MSHKYTKCKHNRKRPHDPYRVFFTCFRRRKAFTVSCGAGGTVFGGHALSDGQALDEVSQEATGGCLFSLWSERRHG